MPLVTVCIPAYRTGPKIAATLQSVKDQSFKDFCCVVAFDPPSVDQKDFVAPFLDDSRFRCHENPRRLGWDGNVRALMAGVETPLFTVLLHDDLINPVYLEALVGRMTADPTRSAAYSDIWQFGGHDIPSINAMDLPENASRINQVMAFLLQRTEAVSWRGVARSSILRDHSFPVDGYGGFAAECEWTLQLLLCGPLQRVPRPLYYKRYAASGLTTASQRWGDLALDTLIAAWNGHRTRMIGMIHDIAEASPAQTRLFDAAAEAALLSRLIQTVRVNRTPRAVREAVQNDIDRANAVILQRLRNSEAAPCLKAKIDSMRIMANALWAIWQEDWEEALRLAGESAACDPDNAEALFARARMLVRLRRYREALEPALSVLSISPHKRGLAELMRTISNAVMVEPGVDASATMR